MDCKGKKLLYTVFITKLIKFHQEHKAICFISYSRPNWYLHNELHRSWDKTRKLLLPPKVSTVQRDEAPEQNFYCYLLWYQEKHSKHLWSLPASLGHYFAFYEWFQPQSASYRSAHNSGVKLNHFLLPTTQTSTWHIQCIIWFAISYIKGKLANTPTAEIFRSLRKMFYFYPVSENLSFYSTFFFTIVPNQRTDS